MQEQDFLAMKPGDLFEGRFLKPATSAIKELEECVIDIISGEVLHFSRASSPQPPAKSTPPKTEDPTNNVRKSTRYPHLKRYLENGHHFDPILWDQCAYYPQGGCQYCRWDWPNTKCPHAPILVRDRGAGVRGWKPYVVNREGGRRGKSEREIVLEIINSLPEEMLEEIMKGGEK